MTEKELWREQFKFYFEKLYNNDELYDNYELYININSILKSNKDEITRNDPSIEEFCDLLKNTDKSDETEALCGLYLMLNNGDSKRTNDHSGIISNFCEEHNTKLDEEIKLLNSSIGSIDAHKTPKSHKYLNCIKAFLKKCCDLHKNIHHCICEAMFNEIRNGESVYVFIDDYEKYKPDENDYLSVFKNVEHIEKGDEIVDYLSCSVVSEKILEYDRLMFENLNEGNYHAYRPYAIEFIIPVYKSGKISGVPFDINEIKKYTNENGEPFWFEAQISAEKPDSAYIEGELLTSANPITLSDVILKYKGVLSPEKVKDIEIAYKNYIAVSKHGSVDLDKVLVGTNLNKKLAGININQANVFNIGHGNFIALKDKKNKYRAHIIYDIGLTYRTSFKNFKKYLAYDYIKNIQTDMVIISHWDRDHYMASFENTNNIFDVPWIVPECCEVRGKINARRIICYLNIRHLVYMIDRSSSPNRPVVSVNFNNGLTMEIYRGEGKDSKITQINCEGLALKFESKDKTTLMCGDVPYICLKDLFEYKDITYLIVPHHASEMSNGSYDVLDKVNNKIEDAVICANASKAIGKSHYSNLRSKANNIIFTPNVSLSYDFDLL